MPASHPPHAKRKKLGVKRAAAHRKKKSSRGWLQWWPVLLGIVLAPVAARAVDILALTGPWQARALVPWTFLPQGHALHLPQGWADHVAAAVLWAQFPMYGVLFVLLHRRLRAATALGLLFMLHATAYIILFAVASS